MTPMKRQGAWLDLLACIAAAGCVSQPIGPAVAVMPGPNKPFIIFQQDDALCKQYAGQRVAGGAAEANAAALGTAAAGTALGAGVGAAAGGHGAAAGAGLGAVAGTAVGTAPAQWSQLNLQQRYDVAYLQCMYARGNQVPGFAAPAAPPPPRPGAAPPSPQ